MNKLLQLTTYGLKCIEKPIVLEFANQTIAKGAKKINNIKGIYGYNGAGKTALITSVLFYKKLVLDPNFLLQNETQRQLADLINKKTNEFFVSCTFNGYNNIIIRHSIKLIRNKETKAISIKEEKFQVATGRTLNENYVSLIEKNDNFLWATEKTANTFSKNLNNADFDVSSFVSVFVRNFVSKLTETREKLDFSDALLLDFFFNVQQIAVCTLKSDDFSNKTISKATIMSLLKKNEDKDDSEEIIIEESNKNTDVILKNNLIAYETQIKLLVKFLKIFKPELNDIGLEKMVDGEKYRIRKVFIYDDYSVDFEYESSGIKQLVNLFGYLKKCADGKLVFIDEMDVNINAAYFKKLVSYFANFGKGQLVFTTHNIESMDAIKNQRRAINAIGFDGEIDTWVALGNRSPINDYMGGYFVHSPMNVEDFDFISVFEGK